MISRLHPILLVFWVVWAAAGCGYKFAGTGTLPKGVKTLQVLMLKNNTNEAGIERRVTNAIINELTRNGVTMVKDEARADAVLAGSVASVDTETIARSSANTSSERRVYVRLNLKLTDRQGKTIWTGKDLQDNEAYPADTNEDLQRTRAVEELVERLAQSAYRRLTDDF